MISRASGSASAIPLASAASRYQREAVAAEPGEVHQIDVLHVGAFAQVLDQPAEGGRLQLGAGRGVELGCSHAALLSLSRHRWRAPARSAILPRHR